VFFYYLQTLKFCFLFFWANLVMIKHYSYDSIGIWKMITHVEGWGTNHEQMLMLEVEHVHLQDSEMRGSTHKKISWNNVLNIKLYFFTRMYM
jgi:hypothetical protein